MSTDIVKMSSKGQLVVPEDIREEEGFEAGDRFVPLAVKDGVLFKRVKLPELRVEFEQLAKDIEAHFKKERISPEDVHEAVKWARKKSS